MLPYKVLDFWMTHKEGVQNPEVKQSENRSQKSHHNPQVSKSRAEQFHKRYVAKRDVLAS
jgi:hypothetical protein